MFYPVRFELWFISDKTGIEHKVLERKNIIDGWDF